MKISLSQKTAQRNSLKDNSDMPALEIENALNKTPDSDSIESIEKEISGVQSKVDTLGAINLAAIDELKDQQERKVYLDNQYDDLSKSVDTLEGAIKTIDNETKVKFKDIFDQINNNLKSFLVELNSTLDENITNKLQVGYTHFDDFRNPKSAPMPAFRIQDGSGGNYIIAGHEPFSIHNKLDQKVFQITDNLNYTVGNHSFTFGASFEKFQFQNSFNLAGYDNFGNPNGYAGTFYIPYSNVAAFLADAAKPFATSIIAQNLLYAQNQFEDGYYLSADIQYKF